MKIHVVDGKTNKESNHSPTGENKETTFKDFHQEYSDKLIIHNGRKYYRRKK